MFGIRFFKGLPNQFIIRYRKGKKVQEGQGISFWYASAVNSLVLVPLESREQPFAFKETSNDFQDITIQGQVTWQVEEPLKLAGLLDLTIGNRGYLSDDMRELPDRLVNIVQDQVRREMIGLDLAECLARGRELGPALLPRIQEDPETRDMGLRILGLRISSLKPNPETARALEAGKRELLLQEADEAIYRRRNAAVEQERIIQENELNTRIAVEEKEREIQARKIRAAEEKQVAQTRMEKQRKECDIALEQMNQNIVTMKADNVRKEGDADAYRIAAFMKAYNQVDPAILETIKYSGMNPVQILADGFRELARNQGSIGQLNVTPDLMQALSALGQGGK